MTIKGIIFSGPMVRALYDGRKTQTRRLITPQPVRKLIECFWSPTGWAYALEGSENGCTCNPVNGVGYQCGDRLYVRESAAIAGIYSDVFEVRYAAHERASHTEFVEQIPVQKIGTPPAKWARAIWPKYRPSIHMPRAWSRLWLDVTQVRVERLQDITEADALAEGIDRLEHPETGDWGWPQQRYADLWNSLHTAEGTRWEDNPWIVAITFNAFHGNIDGDVA